MSSTPRGCGTPTFGEEGPAAALRAEAGVAGIGAVHGDAEGDREVALELDRVVRDEVAEVGRRDRPADALEQARPVEELAAERASAAVACRDQRQARPGAGAQAPGQQREVVVDDLRGHRRGGDVGHAQRGIAELEQRAQEPLLVGLRLGGRLVPLVDRARRDDDDRTSVTAGSRRGGDDDHARLQLGEVRPGVRPALQGLRAHLVASTPLRRRHPMRRISRRRRAAPSPPRVRPSHPARGRAGLSSRSRARRLRGRPGGRRRSRSARRCAGRPGRRRRSAPSPRCGARAGR